MNEARDISKPMMNDANPANWKIGWVSVSALLGSLLTSPIGWLKNALVFHPNTEVRTSPAEYGMPYEDVWFGGSDRFRCDVVGRGHVVLHVTLAVEADC